MEYARKRIENLFKRYPSLRTKLKPELDYAWAEAAVRLREWLEASGLNPEDYHIPEKCPYTYEEAMTRDLRREIEG